MEAMKGIALEFRTRRDSSEIRVSYTHADSVKPSLEFCCVVFVSVSVSPRVHLSLARSLGATDTSLLSLDRYASKSLCKCECASIHFQLTMSMHLVVCQIAKQTNSLKGKKATASRQQRQHRRHQSSWAWNGFRTRFGAECTRASWHNMIQRIPLCCVSSFVQLTAWYSVSHFILLLFFSILSLFFHSFCHISRCIRNVN